MFKRFSAVARFFIFWNRCLKRVGLTTLYASEVLKSRWIRRYTIPVWIMLKTQTKTPARVRYSMSALILLILVGLKITHRYNAWRWILTLYIGALLLLALNWFNVMLRWFRIMALDWCMRPKKLATWKQQGIKRFLKLLSNRQMSYAKIILITSVKL